MSTDVIADIADAFEWHDARANDEQWLPVGTSAVLRGLQLVANLSDSSLWGVALLLCVMQRGGSCLPFAHLRQLPEFSRLPEPLRDLRDDEWRNIFGGDVVGDGDDLVRPLAVVNDRLYFDRLLRLERHIAEILLQPLGDGALTTPTTWSSDVAEVFGDDPRFVRQRGAAETLFNYRVSVLAGGPGTGKTYTVAKILIALHRATEGKATVRLCAPTGKAASRIHESLSDVLYALQEEGAVTAGEASNILSGVQPTTIHRLLHITPLTPRRGQRAPLHVDFVICDETSMVDVALFSEMLSAISPDTRILLVGDPNQLQSIDVGTVMNDLVEALQYGLHGTVLDEVLRIDSGSSELKPFFSAIREDHIEEALSTLQQDSDILTFVDASSVDEAPATQAVFQRADELVGLASRTADRREFRPVLESVMVLTAQHRGDLSRMDWVSRVAQHLNVQLRDVPSTSGLPVLITATDHTTGVINGDSGLVMRDSTSDALVYKPATLPDISIDDSLTPTALPVTALHEWQPWWAMTIHKSQGSEFDHVIVSMTPGTRLLSKELLYTAVTRARQRVTIIGRVEDVEFALKNPAKRFSGLAAIVKNRN